LAPWGAHFLRELLSFFALFHWISICRNEHDSLMGCTWTLCIPTVLLFVVELELGQLSIVFKSNNTFGSSVGIALDYGLDDRVSRVRFPEGAGNFSLHHCVQNGSGAHPASYPMDTRGLSLGVKRPGREADHSPTSSAEVKNAWSCTSTPPVRLHGVVLS
jgi:hypothetical protein